MKSFPNKVFSVVYMAEMPTSRHFEILHSTLDEIEAEREYRKCSFKSNSIRLLKVEDLTALAYQENQVRTA